jgi:beta-lactam-binding protein with PASTA domain
MPANVVPDCRGLYYYDAQAALRAAALLISFPTFILQGSVFVNLTADSSQFTADTTLITADENFSPLVSPQLPGYVVGQSIAPGTVVSPQTRVDLTVIGFTVINQPNNPVPVP